MIWHTASKIIIHPPQHLPPTRTPLLDTPSSWDYQCPITPNLRTLEPIDYSTAYNTIHSFSVQNDSSCQGISLDQERLDDRFGYDLL